MSKLVEQLRSVDHGSVTDCFMQSPLFEKAADAITALEAENAGLRAERDERDSVATFNFYVSNMVVDFLLEQEVFEVENEGEAPEDAAANIIAAIKRFAERRSNRLAEALKAKVDGMSGPHNLATALANLAAAHNVDPGKLVKFSTTYKVLPDGSIQAKELQLIEVREGGKVE